MIPKNFIAGKNRKLNIEELEKPVKKPSKTKELKDLIIDEIELDCTRKEIHEKYDSNSLYLEEFGIGVTRVFVKKAIRIRYYRDNLNYQEGILLIEYESKPKLEEDFENIYEEVMRFENGTVYEEFLSKNNFAIFLFIQDKDITKKTIDHYRNLGFKQLERTLRII